MLVIIISYNQDFFEQFVFLLTGITSNSLFLGSPGSPGWATTFYLMLHSQVGFSEDNFSSLFLFYFPTLNSCS